MKSSQLQEFGVKQKKLAGMIKDTAMLVQELDMQHTAQSLRQLQDKIASDTFKIMVMGNFKNGKSTFINAFLGQEVLPAYAIPTTAIINEVKYGEKQKAVLHFINPQPGELYDGIPEEALSHMRRFHNKDIPPIEMPVDSIEDYVVIPMGVDRDKASKQSPFEKVELFWPLDLLQEKVEIVDSPGLNENEVRTVVTMDYLSKADAIIFVFSALAMGSSKELDYIETTLKQNGFEEQSLFCVVNRFDQLTNQREQARVKKFSDDLLTPYTKHIFYTSAYKGLRGKLEGDGTMVQESGIPFVESELENYLANERGRVKLAAPSRELLNIIRKEALDKVIPQRKSALSTDLDVLKERYNAAQPEISKLMQQKEVIISKAEAKISNMEPEVRRSAMNYFNNLPGQIRVWVEEYEPEAKVSALHPKRDAETLSEELNDFVRNKIDAETRQWLVGPFAQLLEDKVTSLKESLEGRLEEFFVSLDQIKVGITGSEVEGSEGMPVWKRVVAAGGGLLVGDLGVAALGAVSGLSSDFAKGIAIQIGAYFALALVGLLNPFTIIAVIAASVIRGGLRVTDNVVKNAKAQVIQSYCEGVSNNSMQLTDEVVKGAMENFSEIKAIISRSMDVEISEMRNQMDNIIRDMEQGKAYIEKKNAALTECEEKLKEMAEQLDGFIFELIK